MNLIERAGRQLGSFAPKSLVEKAAERLETSEPAPGAAVPGSAAPLHDAASRLARRETRRHISIDFETLRANGFALPGDQSVVAEEFRLIKRPLLTNAFAPS